MLCVAYMFPASLRSEQSECCRARYTRARSNNTLFNPCYVVTDFYVVMSRFYGEGHESIVRSYRWNFVAVNLDAPVAGVWNGYKCGATYICIYCACNKGI